MISPLSVSSTMASPKRARPGLRGPVRLARLVVPLLLLALGLIVPLPARAADGTVAPGCGHLQRILQRGVLDISLYHQDKPPFVMTDDQGKLYGLDIDIARMIASELGVTPHFDRSAKSYSELVERLSRGETDIVLCKLSSTLGRAVKILFSTPYLSLRQTLVLNKKFMARERVSPEYPMTDLRAMPFRIGVREKTSYVEFAHHLFPAATIVEGKWDDLVRRVRSGEVDGLMRDDYTVLGLFSNAPDLAIDLSAYILTDQRDPIAAGLPPQSIDFKLWLDLFFAERMPVKKTARDLVREYPDVLTGE